MLFLESKAIPGSLSFCCVIALELHYIVFKLIRRAKPTPSFDSKKRKWNFHWWCSDGQLSQLLVWKKWHDVINEEVSVEQNNVLMKLWNPIDPSVYLHCPVTDVKCWVSVNHVLQLLSIPTVNNSRRPYTFLKSEFKDTQKQFTENPWTWTHGFMHLPIEICPSTSNSLIIIGNF